MKLRYGFSIAFFSFFLAACGGETPQSSALTAQPTAAASAAQINWFDGSVEEAFARAAENSSPLYLYWGAVWCPPCEEINQTVFKDPAFIAQSDVFIPVYLDGDTGRAQTWGEHFAVQGYPTMIIFDSAGEEITRIPGAIDVELYNDVLKTSLQGLRKTSELLESALQSPQQLSRADYTQLAYYSWDQENLERDVSGDLLRQLAASALQADNELAASRLFMQSLALSHLQDEALSAEEKQAGREWLRRVLESEDLTIANFDFSMFWPEEFISLLTEPGEERQALSRRWAETMNSMREHESLSKAEQLGSWYPELHLYWLNHPEADSLPEDRLRAVREHVASMDRNTRGSARQTVINKAYQVLQAAHLYDESKELLVAEIDKSKDPYYFMSGLASLAEQQGDYDEAVHWLEQAYEHAEGKATRFQWGVEYVTGMIELQPGSEEEISESLAGLLYNLDEVEDVFAGRNFGRLQTLLAALDEWPVEFPARELVEAFYQRLESACAQVDRESIAWRNCSQLEL